MSELTTGAGHEFYVSAAAPATFDQAGWEAVSGWELTPCMSEIPEIAKSFSKVAFECLFTASTNVARGVAEPVELAVPFKDDPSNSGQIIVENAFNADNGTASELLSIKAVNPTDTQQVYLQVRVFVYGTATRVMNEVFMRKVEMVGDASTLVEVNS